MESLEISVLNWRDPDHPRSGGSEELVWQECVGLVRRGHEVSLFTSSFPGAARQQVREGVSIYRRGGRFAVYPMGVLGVRDAISAERCDFVLEHVNGVPWFTPLWSREPSVSFLYHRVGRTFFEELPFPMSLAGFGLESMLPAIYRNQPCAVLGPATGSEFVRQGFGRTQLHVVPPGVDHEMFNPGNREPSPVRVLILGPLKQYKRVDLAIRALPYVRKVVPEVKCTVIGRDRSGLTAGLAHLAESLGVRDHIEFRGYVSSPEKAQLMRNSSVILYTSEREAWGLGVTEAAACGTAAIGPDITGLRDSISDGVTGLLFWPGSVSGLATALIRVLTDHDLRNSLAQNAYERARTLTWDGHVRNIEKLALTVVRTVGD